MKMMTPMTKTLNKELRRADGCGRGGRCEVVTKENKNCQWIYKYLFSSHLYWIVQRQIIPRRATHLASRIL